MCEAFADVIVSEKAAQKSLPEQGVPEASVEEALGVREAEHFKPTILSPATMRNPGTAVEEEVEARPETEEVETGESKSHCDGTHGAVAEEHSERVDQCMAENIISLEEAHVDDPGARFAVLQRKLEMQQKETKNLEQRERQRESATRTAAELQAGIEGQREHGKQVALDIRELAKKMGAKYELELERSVSAAGSMQRGETSWAPTEHRSDVQGLALQGPAAVLEARAAESEVPLSIAATLKSLLRTVVLGALRHRRRMPPLAMPRNRPRNLVFRD